MTPARLRRLLLAPELIVVDLAEATLSALRHALLVEHPTVTEFPDADKSPILIRAAVVLRASARLRRALRAYRRAIDQRVDDPDRDDLPF